MSLPDNGSSPEARAKFPPEGSRRDPETVPGVPTGRASIKPFGVKMVTSRPRVLVDCPPTVLGAAGAVGQEAAPGPGRDLPPPSAAQPQAPLTGAQHCLLGALCHSLPGLGRLELIPEHVLQVRKRLGWVVTCLQWHS